MMMHAHVFPMHEFPTAWRSLGDYASRESIGEVDDNCDGDLPFLISNTTCSVPSISDTIRGIDDGVLVR